MKNLKIYQFVIPFIILFISAMTFGCQDNGKSVNEQPLLSTEKKEKIAQERKELKMQIEAQLDAADQQIEKINERMTTMGENVGEDISTEYQQAMDELKVFRKDLDTKLTEIGTTTEENWEQFKTELDPYLTQVQNDMKALGDKIEEALTEDEKK